jgi:NAD(P)-dependent dehydrogenase (short-subunit alcohol dehydrogenase family)
MRHGTADLLVHVRRFSSGFCAAGLLNFFSAPIIRSTLQSIQVGNFRDSSPARFRRDLIHSKQFQGGNRIMAQATDGSSAQRARGFYFRDKAVVITGASSGIGQDAALSFARQGAQVALLARRKSVLDDLAGKINAEGGRAIAIGCDVTKRSDVDGAVEQAMRSFNRLDILVNSAGIMVPGEVENIKLTDLERMMSVNLYGALNAIQAAMPHMRKQGTGNIVNIASLAGRRGMSPQGGYCASKFAMVGLTEALRMETYGTGIRVSLVMPGLIDTPMADTVVEGVDMSKMPSFFKMPVQWVTWAIFAAAAFGLEEVDVPPGAVMGEKIAALFPGVTDAFLSAGAQMMKAAARLIPKAAGETKSEPKKESAQKKGG